MTQMIPPILKLDVSGLPVEWVTWQTAATIYARNRVRWEAGEARFVLCGGRDAWTNVLTACVACNHRKNDCTPEEARMLPLGCRSSPIAGGKTGACNLGRMALTATVHTFTLQLADADRNVYCDLELRVARHPSETSEFMLARVLAYCLEYEEGIAFTDGIAAVDEPAVLVRDLTGRIRAWIEVGAPDAERLHRGAKRADRAAVYAHKEVAPWLAQMAGQRIHRATEIPVHGLDPAFLRDAAAAIQRRNQTSLSVSGRVIYLDINGHSLSGEVRTFALT